VSLSSSLLRTIADTAAPDNSAAAVPSKEAERISMAKKKGELDKFETREALASAQAALQVCQKSPLHHPQKSRMSTFI